MDDVEETTAGDDVEETTAGDDVEETTAGDASLLGRTRELLEYPIWVCG